MVQFVFGSVSLSEGVLEVADSFYAIQQTIIGLYKYKSSCLLVKNGSSHRILMRQLLLGIQNDMDVDDDSQK